VIDDKPMNKLNYANVTFTGTIEIMPSLKSWMRIMSPPTFVGRHIVFADKLLQ
jgi:hypothetical protein